LTFRLIQAVRKIQLIRTWLCAGISPLLYELQTWSKHQKMRKACSLLSKKFFGWGVRVFCQWRQWRTFWPPWPISHGPGRQPLGGSISLKFLLDSMLQSESFDTLDDLLGFWIQKLW